METKNGVKIFGGTFILFFISLSILSGCGLFEKEKKDNSNGNQTQMQKFTDIFTKLPLFDSSKQKYSTSKRIYPKSSSVSVWEKVIGGSSDDIAYSIIQSSDGGYVVAGGTWSFGAGGSDFYVVKLDSSGNVQWTKTIGGGGYYVASSYDVAYSIIQSSDGGYVIIGETTSFGAGGEDIYVVKLDSSGNVVWTKTIGEISQDEAYSIIQSSDGGYVVVGSYGGVGGTTTIMKLDSAGNVVWAKSFYGVTAVRSITQGSDGGYVVTGEYFGNLAKGGDIHVLKVDSAGNFEWAKNISGGCSVAHSIIQSSDGGYVVVGQVWNPETDSFDICVLKLDSSGNVEWTKTIGGSYYDEAYSIIQSSDGGYVVAGYGVGLDLYVVKLDQSGNVEWIKTIGGEYKVAYSIIQSSDGGYVLAGRAWNPGTDSYDIYVVKIAEDIQNCSERYPVFPIVSTGGSIIVTDVVPTVYSLTPIPNSITPVATSPSPSVQVICQLTCVPEVCNDGVDNDCDGLSDCADPDCSANPACCVVGAGKEIVLPYGSNWRYLVAPLGTQIPGFENTGFDDSSWNEGPAPFGSYSCNGVQMCPFDPSSLTCWPSNSSIFLRKFFFVPSSAQSIKIKAKYNSMHAKLYFNGNLWVEGDVQACGEEITDGIEIPASPPYVFAGGTNLIALQLENSQGTSFFDISIEAVVVGEVCNDGVDNDCDGLIDCADPDCSANPACLPSDAPDLKAEKIKLKCNPPQGQNVCRNGYQVFFSFKNIGTQSAGPFRATIYLSQDGTLDNSDNPIGYCDFTGLAVGAWAQCVVPPTSLPPGWFVIGFVDSGNQVLEMNEQNNIISYQIPNQPLPDLTGQWIDQPEIKNNNRVRGRFKVCNEGPAPAGSFRVSIYKSSDQNLDLGDQVVDTHNISNLPGGDCHTIPIDLANGNSYRNYYLIVFVDSLGQITELDEDNNVIPSEQIP
jgi:hypothetical protein